MAISEELKAEAAALKVSLRKMVDKRISSYLSYQELTQEVQDFCVQYGDPNPTINLDYDYDDARLYLEGQTDKSETELRTDIQNVKTRAQDADMYERQEYERLKAKFEAVVANVPG